MNGGSLFSGIGGLDLGAERAGVRVRWQCERDEWRRSVLAHHWPHIPCYSDVSIVKLGRVREVEVVFGGFPCQPASQAGRRLGRLDERWLWPEFGRVVRELEPRYVVVENVTGLLARGFGDVLGDLAALGYDTEWTVFGAGDLGGWHQRDRVFLVAAADADQVKVWDESGGLFGPGWAAPLLPRLAGLEKAVADADAPGQQQQQQRQRVTNGGRWSRDRTEAQPVAAATLFGRETGRDELRRLRATPEQLADRAEALGGDWWAAEPGVARMAHGVPGGVVRREGLGDAVVPACAELVFRRLIELDRGNVPMTAPAVSPLPRQEQT